MSILVFRPMVHSVFTPEISVPQLKDFGIAMNTNFGWMLPRKTSASSWLLCFVKSIWAEGTWSTNFERSVKKKP